MRHIKFRGRDLSGKMRYGFYAESAGFPYIIENHTWYEVQSDTVAQLVGYDANGKEVYEGDTLIVGKNGAEYVVDYRDPPDYIIWHFLKETSHD